MDRCPHPYAVRLYSHSLDITEASTPNGKAFYLLNMPHFLTSQIPNYLDWLIEIKSS